MPLDQLRIRSVRLACDFLPRRLCHDTLYAPFYFADPSPVLDGRSELLYTMGGHVDEPQTPELSSPGRFADKIYYSHRGGDRGSWTSPRPIITKAFFPWMGDDAFLAAHPEAFVGSVAGPNVFKRDGTYHMIFSATVSDPNVCTGEHPPTPNVHGSCTEPWSYFAIFWATSADGAEWTLRNMQRSNPNVALRHAAVYYTPTRNDTLSGSFKGLAMPHGVVELDGMLYLFAEFWNSVGLRNIVLRTGDLSTFELFDGGGWERLDDGRMPDWSNREIWRGNPYAHIISQVCEAPLFGDRRFLLTAQGSGERLNNCVEYAASNDLVNWSPERIVESSVRHVADGTGGENSVLNPVIVPDGVSYRILFATNDYDQDGRPDCDGPYPGLAIFEGLPEVTQTAEVHPRRRPSDGSPPTERA